MLILIAVKSFPFFLKFCVGIVLAILFFFSFNALRSNASLESKNTPVIEIQKIPKKVIIVVIDGMGANYLEAASWYQYGKPGALHLQQLPHQGQVNSIGSDKKIPDSANSMAMLTTGQKLPYRSLSVKKGQPLQTIAEYYQSKGKSIALVVNSSITDATPAAYFSHQNSRKNHDQIWAELLAFKPDLIMGGPALNDDKSYRDLAAIRQAGYQIVLDKKGLANADLSKPIFGQFQWDLPAQQPSYNMPWILDYETTHYGIPETELKQVMSLQAPKVKHLPTLKEMALKAFQKCQQNAKGYLLVVEQALSDKAAHLGFKNTMLAEILHIDETVKALYEKIDDETLLIVTADHETGGLVLAPPYQKGVLPKMTFTSFYKEPVRTYIKSKEINKVVNDYINLQIPLSENQKDVLQRFEMMRHSPNAFPVFAVGPGAEQLSKMTHISDIYKILYKY